jgi:hypothetical protein
VEGSEEAVRFLDLKIAETEGELERLRQLLASTESDVRALRKARDVLVGDDGGPRSAARTQDLPAEEVAPPPRPIPPPPRPVASPPRLEEVKRGDPGSPVGRSAAASRQGPLRLLVLEILREAGKPLHVDELVERLRAAGKHTDHTAVMITLAEYVKAGKLWRTPQETYGLSKGFGS